MRVLVTRPQVDGERTAAELAAGGHEAVLAPVLRIEATGEPPPPGRFDALVLTSGNAAPRLAALDPHIRSLPIFAVGARTAAAATEAGCRDVRAAGGDAASLGRLVAQTAPRGTILLVAGRDRKPEPEASLSAAGFVVATWIAYEAIAADRFAESGLRALRDRRLDAALHYSRRSAEIALRLLDRVRLAAPFLGLAHVCLSADAASPLRAAGARTVTVAAGPEEASLLAALDLHAKKDGTAGSRPARSEW